MKNYKNYIQGTGQCVPYKDLSTTSIIAWTTSSSNPMSTVELCRNPVGYSRFLIMIPPDEGAHLKLIKEQENEIKKNALFNDQDPLESCALLTMMASEDVLGRDWNSPIEDEAWANL